MKEIYFCTDIETSGQSYATGSMMTIGVIPVMEFDGHFERILESEFYIRLHPRFDAMHMVRSDVKTLEWWRLQDPRVFHEAFHEKPRDYPYRALLALKVYVESLSARWDATPIFAVAGPVGFDYSFVSNYFYEFQVDNPFGEPGRTLDMKSYFMGMTGFSYAESCSKEKREQRFGSILEEYHSHHALGDAKYLAAFLCKMLNAKSKF